MNLDVQAEVKRLAKETCGDCRSTPCSHCAYLVRFGNKLAAVLMPWSPSSWQQRIAAMNPWVNRNGPYDVVCYFCGSSKEAGYHASDCDWQHAKDAPPPVPDASPTKEPPPIEWVTPNSGNTWPLPKEPRDGQ